MISSYRVERIDLDRADRVAVDIYHPDPVPVIRRYSKYLRSVFPDPEFPGGNDRPAWSGCCGDDVVALGGSRAIYQSREENNSDQETGQAGVHDRNQHME